MNIKAIADKIGIDYDNVLEDFCGDVSALNAKLQSFADSGLDQEFKKAIENANYSEAKNIAHKIRNLSEKVGLSLIAKAASRVEKADVDKLKSAASVLEERLEETITVLTKTESEE